jgi:predicted metal-dependent phosphoesterase TrpH
LRHHRRFRCLTATGGAAVIAPLALSILASLEREITHIHKARMPVRERYVYTVQTIFQPLSGSWNPETIEFCRLGAGLN